MCIRDSIPDEPIKNYEFFPGIFQAQNPELIETDDGFESTGTHIKTKFTKKYFEDYRRTYGEDANNYAGILTYDAILVLTQALEKGGKEKLVETLEHGEFVGAAGVYKFNEKHQALWGSEKLKGVIAEYVDGVKILYPDEFATSEVIWPG